MSEQSQSTYPGERLGLPAEGPRSVASWGRRIAAIAIDWAASWLVALAIFPGQLTDGRSTTVDLVAVPAVAVVQTALLTALVSGSFGHIVCRLAVVSVNSRPLGLLRPLLRAVLVYLIVPPLVFNRDSRGLHDLAAGTVVIRR